jgi:hypothetical protein
LWARYERGKKIADLDAAIEAFRLSVDATPMESSDRAVRLSNLGSALLDRFEQKQLSTDLDAAVEARRAAVEVTPHGDDDRSARLAELGNALLARFKRTGVRQDLDAAVAKQKAAVEATAESHPDRGPFLSNLGTALLAKFEQSGELRDLESAIESQRAAVEATLASDTERPHRVVSLKAMLQMQIDRAGEELAGLDDSTPSNAIASSIPPHSPQKGSEIATILAVDLMAPDAPYRESAEYSWTEKAFSMLGRGDLSGEVVSRDGIVRSRIWGICPRCGHSLDDWQTHTAVIMRGGEWHWRDASDANQAHPKERNMTFLSVDVSCGCGDRHSGAPVEIMGCGISFRVELPLHQVEQS